MSAAIVEKQTVAAVPEASLKEQLIADIALLGVMAHNRTKRCVFVDFHGHVNNLSISVRESAADYPTELATIDIQLQPFDFYDSEQKEAFEQNLMEELMSARQFLEDLIVNGDIDTEVPLPIAT